MAEYCVLCGEKYEIISHVFFKHVYRLRALIQQVDWGIYKTLEILKQ